MAKYILDTNILSYLWDTKSQYHSKIINQLNNLNNDDTLGISVVSYYELRYGVESINDTTLKDTFAHALEVLKNDKDFLIFSLDYSGAEYFSDLKSAYKKSTQVTNINNKRNDIDFMIASLAMSENAVIVSNDTISQLDKRLLYANWTL